MLTVFLLRFLVGYAFGTGFRSADWARLLAAAVVCELAVFSVYLFNGVMDVAEDRINGSRRPIARGDLDRGAAMTASAVSLAAALAGAVFLGWYTLGLIAVLALVGYLYSCPPHLKRTTTGTIVVVSVMGVCTYRAGFIAATGENAVSWHANLEMTVLAVAAALWMGLVGGPAKDLPDKAGDIAAGRQTMLALRGDRVARRAMAGAAIALALAFIAVVRLLSLALLPPAFTMLAGAIAVTVLNFGNLSEGSRSQRRRPYRAFMLTQYGINLSALLLH